MNKLFACLALAFVAPIFGSLYAQDEDAAPEQYEPPPPVGMDVDYFAPPKQKLSIGFRFLPGPKISYSGSGMIPSGVTPGAYSTTTSRTYNDGAINPDGRLDATTGAALAPDGKSDSWNFDSASQMDAANNGVDMHTYDATIDGNNPHSGRANAGAGFELTFERDFGWHLGRVQFDLIGGLSMNKISYSRTASVAGMLTTNTDVYNTYNTVVNANGDPVLDGNGNPTYTPPATPANSPTAGSPPVAVTAPYTAPSTTLDSAGNSVQTPTLIGTTPLQSPSTPSNGPAAGQTTSPAEVTEQWNIVGAYFTLRAGAQMTVPITDKLSACVSGGPALVYVGTTFTVNQTITPPTGSAITDTLSNDYSTVLPAYFADADIEYSFTDTTDLYLGAVFQSTTGYNQAIHSADGNYADKINFGNQEGVRAGISFKF